MTDDDHPLRTDTDAIEVREPSTARVVETTDLTAGYGSVPVARGLHLHVDEGEVVAVIGPNGAGKTTTLLTISGVFPALAGDAIVLGHSVRRATPHAIARRGLRLLPDDRGLFHQLTVAQNLRLHRGGSGAGENVDVLSYFPALASMLNRRAGLLSGGEQQMLALACRLVARPKVLLIDELSMGLAPAIVARLLPIVRRIATDSGVGVLLVEQHVGAALEVADRVYVLRQGESVLVSSSADLRRRPEILERAYFDGGATPANGALPATLRARAGG